MDNERHKQNHTLYFIGIICLVIAMALIGFSIYVLPHLLFGWVYDVPALILEWQMYFVRIHGIKSEMAAWIVFFLLLIPGLLAALVATILSNRIDANFHTDYKEQEEGSYRVKREIGQTISILAKILIIVILVIVIIEIIEWILYVPPPSTVSN